MSCLSWKVIATVGLWRSDQVVFFCSNSLVRGSFNYQLDNSESVTLGDNLLSDCLYQVGMCVSVLIVN